MSKSDNNAKNVLEALLEGTDYSEVLTEQQRTKLTELINETVDARVSAKETFLTEEFEKKEAELKESVDAERQRLLTEAEENEKVLVEQAEVHKKALEESALRQVKEYKETAEQKLAEKADLLKENLESMLYEEAKAYKEKKDVALVEEVKKFKGEMIEKVSDYMEAKLEDMIPSEIMEAAAKLDVYEPLVGAIMESFSKSFVKLDDTSYQLIKESKDRIGNLERSLQEEKKRNISLSKEKKEIERNVRIESLTEGLTTNQRQRARKLLEGFDVDEIEGRWAKVRDIILESNTPAPKKSPAKKPEEKVKPLNEGQEKKESDNSQQNDAVINMQVKKVLKEGTVPEPKKEKKEEIINESETRVNAWASKVTPRYTRG